MTTLLGKGAYKNGGSVTVYWGKCWNYSKVAPASMSRSRSSSNFEMQSSSDTEKIRINSICKHNLQFADKSTNLGNTKPRKTDIHCFLNNQIPQG